MGPTDLPRTMAPTEAEVPEYVVDALSDQQRRDIVSYVASADGAVRLLELANHLSTRASAPGGPPRSSPPSKKLLVKLHHVQLPALDRAGLVEYAPEKRRVAFAGEWLLADGFDVENVADLADSRSATVG